METKQSSIYSVVADKRKLKCIDTKNGNIVASSLMMGDIVSGPIVTGDRCVVIIKTTIGNKGKILRLPNLNVITSFDT
jgi:hypothetical protein